MHLTSKLYVMSLMITLRSIFSDQFVRGDPIILIFLCLKKVTISLQSPRRTMPSYPYDFVGRFLSLLEEEVYGNSTTIFDVDFKPPAQPPKPPGEL